MHNGCCNRIGYLWIVVAMVLAIIVGVWKQPQLIQLSEVVAEIFMRLLKLISVPIISLSLLATLSSVGEQSHSRTGRAYSDLYRYHYRYCCQYRIVTVFGP